MKTIRFLSLIFCCCYFTSCSYFMVPSHVKKGFSFCYQPSNPTGIDSLINIHGIYTIKTPYDRYMTGPYKDHVIDTFYTHFMFFEDGLFIYNFGLSKSEDASTYFTKVNNDKKTRDGFESRFWGGGLWGVYIIDHEMIKVQYINHPNPPAPWYGYETWFKIIDRSTLQIIDKNPIERRSESDLKNYNRSKQNVIIPPAHFESVDVLPTSDCWLKKKKFFWCDKKEWQAYKQKIKNKKDF